MKATMKGPLNTATEQILVIHNELALARFAESIAHAVSTVPQALDGLVIYLVGELGAGKTSFARAFIQSLGHKGRVKSPSYGLLEHYPLKPLGAVHLDLYRIADPEELDYLGLSDLLPANVALIEWPEQGKGFLPVADLTLSLDEIAGQSPDFRRLILSAATELGIAVLKALEDVSGEKD